MKLGYSTWGMPTVPIEIAIRHISKLGFDGIELTVIPGYTTELSTLNSSERQRIAKLLKDHHLQLSAISAHSNLLATDKETYQQSMRRLKGGVDLAVELADAGIMPAVNTTPGGSPNQWEELKLFLVERINELVDYAKLQGVTIAMEPHVGAIIDTPDKMRECLDLVDSPYFKVNFDISHFDVVGFSVEEAVAALAPHSIHTHVKDQRGRHPDFEFLIPGEGDFDYVTYLKEMLKFNYDGFITVEVSTMVQKRKDYDPLAAATLSYQTLSHAFAVASIER